MFLISAMLAMTVAGASAATKAADKAISLDALIQKVMEAGRDGALPRFIATAIGIPENTPYRGARIPDDQAKDEMDHVIKVLVDKQSESDVGKPLGLEFNTARDWPGNNEFYYFHASLDGQLENAAFQRGKRDDAGKAIKGSGHITTKDVNSSEIKKRFQRELGCWLKKSCLKKEWRSADISDGELKK